MRLLSSVARLALDKNPGVIYFVRSKRGFMVVTHKE